MSLSILVSVLIVMGVGLWVESKNTERRRVLQQTRRFFGNAVLMTKKTSYWQKYLDGLQVQLNRIGINISVRKYARYAVTACVAFIVITHEILGLPWLLPMTISVLLILFPKQIIAELSSRYVVKIRKRILVDVLKPGMHALHNSPLHEVFAQIEKEAKSPIIRREFHVINQLGKAPGMDVGQAMLIRAKTLGIREFEILAKATIEGNKWNANLKDVWTDVYRMLAKKVSTQNQIQAATSTFRMVAIALFLTAVFVIVFAYPLLHVHGVIQVGLVIMLISFFIGISQVVKTKEVY